MPVSCRCNRQWSIWVVAIVSMLSIPVSLPAPCYGDEWPCQDRLWLINTRSITSNVCALNLELPPLSVCRLDCEGDETETTLSDYLNSLDSNRSAVVYIHGNRMEAHHARFRGVSIYKSCCSSDRHHPIDWVIWSWPSSKAGTMIKDARAKASRTDAQGLYLAWLLRHHASNSVPTTLIGYSFGGRVATGALHALAGGPLGQRALSGPPIMGVSYRAGLIAPAIGSHWLDQQGYHRLATKNLDRMVLMYNRRDVVLKRYWLIDKIRGRMALGLVGPTRFATRADGSKLPVRARDCSQSIGIKHDELEYFTQRCRAGCELASLIDDMSIAL